MCRSWHKAWPAVDGQQLGCFCPLCWAVWVLRTAAGLHQVKALRRRDSGSRVSASGRGRLERPPPPSKAPEPPVLSHPGELHNFMDATSQTALSLWGLSRVGICLSHYCLPRQVPEDNRCLVNRVGWAGHPKSCGLSGSQELGVLDTFPPHLQLCSRKTQGLQVRV